MKQKFKDLLYFLRLTDDDGVLSITHIGCLVVLTKVALNPNPSIADMGGLLITLSMYYGKKHLAKNKLAMQDDNKMAIAKIEGRLAQLADKQGAVATALGFKPNQK